MAKFPGFPTKAYRVTKMPYICNEKKHKRISAPILEAPENSLMQSQPVPKLIHTKRLISDYYEEGIDM